MTPKIVKYHVLKPKEIVAIEIKKNQRNVIYNREYNTLEYGNLGRPSNTMMHMNRL